MHASLNNVPEVIIELRHMKLVDGSFICINETYWDDYDETNQRYDDNKRDGDVAAAYSELARIYKLCCKRYSGDYSEVNKFLTTGLCAFNEHKAYMARGGTQGHDYAMCLQKEYWDIFGGYTKEVIKQNYIAIGFNPEVWLS